MFNEETKMLKMKQEAFHVKIRREKVEQILR